MLVLLLLLLLLMLLLLLLLLPLLLGTGCALRCACVCVLCVLCVCWGCLSSWLMDCSLYFIWSGHLSRILCTRLSQNSWANFDETWWGYPWECFRNWLHCKPSDLTFKVTRGERLQTKTSLLYTIQPKLLFWFDETSWDYVLVVSDELIRFWGMGPNFQGHHD